MKLTAPNGSTINVEKKKILEMGPHIGGGSFVKVGAHRYLVQEEVEAILAANDG